MEKYRIGEGQKLIAIGDTDARESKQEPSERVNIIEQGVVACYESESNKGKNGAQSPAAKVKTDLREAFKRLNPSWTEKQLDIAVQGR